MGSINLLYEMAGSTPDMSWIELPDGKVGLLKKELSRFDLLSENEYATIASFFGLEVSECIRIGEDHFVSLKEKMPRYEIVDAYDVAEINAFELYKDNISDGAYQKLLLLAFVDGVTLQCDRHQGNIAFYKSRSSIIDLYPPYDNVACLRNSYSRKALLCPLGYSCTHAEVFKWLHSNQEQFDSLYALYMSDSFTQLASMLSEDSCEILLEQRDRIHKYLSSV